MFQRNKDLSQVFDERWKAGHNNDVKRKREEEKQFIDKMFNVKADNTSNNIGNMARDFDALNKNMAYNNQINRQNKVNDIKRKF